MRPPRQWEYMTAVFADGAWLPTFVALGMDGWELVSVVGPLAYFKRVKQ